MPGRAEDCRQAQLRRCAQIHQSDRERPNTGAQFCCIRNRTVERSEQQTKSDVTTEISPSEAGTILTVDLEAIVTNWQTLQMVCGDAECGAVVKADAYGLGLNPVVKALYEAGCKTFFVAHPFEGRATRAIAPLPQCTS